MSKWIKKDLFDDYVKKKEQEQEKGESTSFLKRSDIVWPNPTAGSTTQPEVYEGRFLPDPNGEFTLKYFYHMWKTDKWNYVFCEKTHDINNYCPVCSLVNKLYAGTSKDKALASMIKRKTRHVGNFYIVSDKRDLKVTDEAEMNEGKVKLYEFPDKVDAKIKLQLLDKKEGLGADIFDPGEDGYNFILRIKSTKPDGSGRTYPDYSDSDFSRKPSVLGNDKMINQIMNNRYDIKEYVNSLTTPRDRIIAILESEMLYDLVKDEWSKVDKSINEDNSKDIDTDDDVKSKSNDEDDVPIEVEDDSDDDLLKELESIVNN